MPDSIERVGRSKLQHGPFNDRVYLMRVRPEDAPVLLDRAEELARVHRYSKISAKVPEPAAREFLARGYEVEARVPGMYRGRADGLFLARFPDPGRREEPEAGRYEEALAVARTRASRPEPPAGPDPRRCGEDDAEALAGLYRQTFASYPFPIDDPDYIRQAMAGGTLFAGVRDGPRLVAAASAEIDADGLNAELTDFATRPEYRGRSLAVGLLRFLEQQVTGLGILTGYTIARAGSVGMNVVFARAGYRWAGRLANNTNIAGRFESMNIWHRRLDA